MMTVPFAGVPIVQFAPWMLGVAALFALISLPLFFRRHIQRPMRPSLWDVPRVAQIYTTVVGSLAGFAAASAVFVARLGVDRPGAGFETTVGLFMLAFLMLAASAMEFGNTPNATETDPDFVRLQRVCFLIANVTLTLGICTSWLALRSLTLLIGLPALSDMLGALMLVIVLFAAARFGQYLLDFSSACNAVCMATPLLAVGGALLYMGVAAQWLPALRPSSAESLQFGFVVTILATLGFALQSSLFTLHSYPSLRRFVGNVETVAVGYTQVGATSIALLAITVIAR